MAKHAPQLPIEVDSETGVWTTDAQIGRAHV